MKKIIFLCLVVAWGMTAAQSVLAIPGALPSTYNLKEGNVVGAANYGDPDLFIINEYGYKRLFLNPVIFSFYGHLGGYAKVKPISATARDQFETSLLFRNCETQDQRVYALEVTGEDTGTLHHLNMSGSAAAQQDPQFFKKIFCINNREFSWYTKGAAYTSLAQVATYSRTYGALCRGFEVRSPSVTAGTSTVIFSVSTSGCTKGIAIEVSSNSSFTNPVEVGRIYATGTYNLNSSIQLQSGQQLYYRAVDLANRNVLFVGQPFFIPNAATPTPTPSPIPVQPSASLVNLTERSRNPTILPTDRIRFTVTGTPDQEVLLCEAFNGALQGCNPVNSPDNRCPDGLNHPRTTCSDGTWRIEQNLPAYGGTTVLEWATVGGMASNKIEFFITDGSSLIVAPSQDSVPSQIVYWGNQNVPFAKFGLIAKHEGYFIERLTIGPDNAVEQAGSMTNIKNVTLVYKNINGVSMTAVSPMGYNGITNFTWSCTANCGNAYDSRPYVPMGSSFEFTVIADVKTRSEGATNAIFSLDFLNSYNGSYQYGFRAVGETSTLLLDGSSMSSVRGKNMTVTEN